MPKGDGPVFYTIVHWLWVACAALCTCQAGRSLQPWRPTPEACAKIADASGHTPAHEHEGRSSIYLYGRIPDFSHSVRKQSACFPLSYGRIRRYRLYCCKESFCFTAGSEEKTFASVRSILFCTAIMGELFYLSVKSRTSCAFPTATFIQLQVIAVKPHGHKQHYHWLSMVKTIGNALALYHRNHKNKGFNGNGHSPGLVISRCVACVLAIHAQVLGVWAQRLDGRAPPAMCMATHRQPTAD